MGLTLMDFKSQGMKAITAEPINYSSEQEKMGIMIYGDGFLIPSLFECFFDMGCSSVYVLLFVS